MQQPEANSHFITLNVQVDFIKAANSNNVKLDRESLIKLLGIPYRTPCMGKIRRNSAYRNPTFSTLLTCIGLAFMQATRLISHKICVLVLLDRMPWEELNKSHLYTANFKEYFGTRVSHLIQSYLGAIKKIFKPKKRSGLCIFHVPTEISMVGRISSWWGPFLCLAIDSHSLSLAKKQDLLL